METNDFYAKAYRKAQQQDAPGRGGPLGMIPQYDADGHQEVEGGEEDKIGEMARSDDEHPGQVKRQQEQDGIGFLSIELKRHGQ